MGLFGQSKPPDPKEKVREWTSKLRKEEHQLERSIRKIEREEEKVRRSVKEAAKKGDKDTCRILAKELVRSKKAVGRLYTSIAQIKGVSNNMKNQLATARISGALEQSTEVMQAMQRLVRVPEIMRTMEEMSREMMKMGIIEEMVDDTMEMLDEGEDLEDEADAEVDRILWEVTAGEIGKAPDAVEDSLPEAVAADRRAVAGPSRRAVAEEEEDVTEMQARLEQLRS